MIARALLIAAATALVAPANAEPPASTTRASLAELEREVRDHPDDVDRRLQLATALSWANRRDEARREALAVLARAPSYADATLLLARLDAWNQRWPEAHAHLDRVLAAQPAHVEARLLAVDIALWSGDAAAARRALATLRPIEIGEVEYLYRQAQIALAERDHRRALALANRITTLDPDHAGARALGATVSLVSVESSTDTEVFPPMYRDRFAVGETLTATVFPLARWSATFVYEYRRRFATDNHRVGARADWRPTDRWSVLAFVRGGQAEVVPRFTMLVEARWDKHGWIGGGRYTYDRMPWSGDLHRAQVTAGAPLQPRLRVEGDLMVGVLRGCGTSTAVWSARARLAWTHGRWDLAGAYGYGLEADRALTGPDPCASPSRDLVDHDVHAGGVDVTRTLRRGLALRLGYGLELRTSDVLVHLGTLAVRAWF